MLTKDCNQVKEHRCQGRPWLQRKRSLWAQGSVKPRGRVPLKRPISNAPADGGALLDAPLRGMRSSGD